MSHSQRRKRLDNSDRGFKDNREKSHANNSTTPPKYVTFFFHLFKKNKTIQLNTHKQLFLFLCKTILIDHYNSRQKTSRQTDYTQSQPSTSTNNAITPEENFMYERNLYVTMNLVGQAVEVQVKDGTIFEGLFHTANTEKGYGVVLRLARKKDPTATSLPQPIETLVINSSDFVQMIAKDVNFVDEQLESLKEKERSEKDLFKTDKDISRARGDLRERELKPWTPDEDDVIPENLTMSYLFQFLLI
jgi:hypothetical protein